MSHTYHLLCLDCREVLDVGKISNRDREGEARPIGFGGWRDQQTGAWVEGEQLRGVVERWLIQHRGHEVRLVSEPFLDEFDSQGSLRYIDSPQEVLARSVELPDPAVDARRVPAEVGARVRWGSGAVTAESEND